jgi:hypothetical protein
MRAHPPSILFSIAAIAAAQPVVAPTPAQVGSPRGVSAGGYNVTNSFETGYRFRSVGGDYGKHRRDVNYGNGVRLLSSSLTVNSREGRGGWFDEIVLTTLRRFCARRRTDCIATTWPGG